MVFDELLKKLAEACGLDRLEPDESNMVHLGAQGTALTIVGEDETRTVVLMSEIGVLPAEGREKFFRSFWNPVKHIPSLNHQVLKLLFDQTLLT